MSPEPRRRPGAVRRWVVRPLVWSLALLALLVVAAVLLLRSAFLRERAAALLVARLQEYLGRQVEVGRVEAGLLPLELVIHDLVVPGESVPARPLAHRAPGSRMLSAAPGSRPRR